MSPAVNSSFALQRAMRLKYATVDFYLGLTVYRLGRVVSLYSGNAIYCYYGVHNNWYAKFQYLAALGASSCTVTVSLLKEMHSHPCTK